MAAEGRAGTRDGWGIPHPREEGVWHRLEWPALTEGRKLNYFLRQNPQRLSM